MRAQFFSAGFVSCLTNNVLDQINKSLNQLSFSIKITDVTPGSILDQTWPNSYLCTTSLSWRSHSLLHSLALFSTFRTETCMVLPEEVDAECWSTRTTFRSVQSFTQPCPTLRPQGLQHARLPCPSPTPGSCSNLCPSSRWGYPTISSSIISFFSCLQSFPASESNETILRTRWPKYWSFSFSISPSKECSGLISFRVDWFDLLAVQGTLRSLLPHHSSKASVLRHSAFFMVQPIHAWLLEKP